MGIRHACRLLRGRPPLQQVGLRVWLKSNCGTRAHADRSAPALVVAIQLGYSRKRARPAGFESTKNRKEVNLGFVNAETQSGQGQ